MSQRRGEVTERAAFVLLAVGIERELGFGAGEVEPILVELAALEADRQAVAPARHGLRGLAQPPQGKAGLGPQTVEEEPVVERLDSRGRAQPPVGTVERHRTAGPDELVGGGDVLERRRRLPGLEQRRRPADLCGQAVARALGAGRR